MFIYQGTKIRGTVTINDIEYPPNWWTGCTPAELAALGVMEVADPVLPDPNYYTYTENADGTFTQIAIPTEILISTKLAALASYRYNKEICGVSVNGIDIATDRESQAKVNAAWSAAQINPSIVINWKGTTGWVQIDATIINAVASAVISHVQSCFTNEKIHSEAISALTDATAIVSYDFTGGWPV